MSVKRKMVAGKSAKKKLNDMADALKVTSPLINSLM
jgi:hypothetical protein